MTGTDSNFSKVYAYIIKNSLFTPRQISIISKMLQGSGRPKNISSGAYYRQVRQCREKVIATLYSIVLLKSTGVLHPGALDAVSRLADQLSSVMSASESSDVLNNDKAEDVISVIDQLLKRMSRL